MLKTILYVRDTMSRDVSTVYTDMKLDKVMEIMIEEDIDGLPVIRREGTLAGMVTRTDLIHAYSMHMKTTTKVDVIMTENVVTVCEDDPLELAQELMLEQDVGRMPVFDAGQHLVGIVTQSDVLRFATHNLRTINSRFEAIVSSMPDGLAIIDGSGKIVFVNQVFEDFIGMDEKALDGRLLTDIVPAFAPLINRKKQLVMRDVHLQLGQREVLATVSPLEGEEGDMRGHITTFKDVTALEKMAQEITSLGEINENLHTIFSSITEGIHVVNREGITLFYNKAAAALDGLEGVDVVGKLCLDCFPSLTQETSTLMQVTRTGQPLLDQQQTFKNLKGEKITSINSTIPLRSHGNLVGAIEISHNITDVRRMSEKIVDLQAELFRSEISKKPQPKSAGSAYFTFDDIIGSSDLMMRMKYMAYRAAQTSSSVLVHGETGTGKELVVQAIHNASKRRNSPFIAQNCAALPETLLEGILFGTVKGGFTGAEDRPGLFELASGGTLFLDEINSMNLSLQTKLLRVLQEGVIRRVADVKVRPIDVRVIAATNVDPREAVEHNRLRADLFYRLNVVSLRIPPLRERKSDILELIDHFVRKYNSILGMDVMGLEPAATEIFLQYDWPGNVRELEHMIEGCMNIMDGDRILVQFLPEFLVESIGMHRAPSQGEPAIVAAEALSADNSVRPLRDALAGAEAAMIKSAMQEANGNVSKAARLLDVPRQTLQYKLRTLKIIAE